MGERKGPGTDLEENWFPFFLAPPGNTGSRGCCSFFLSLNCKRVPFSCHPFFFSLVPPPKKMPVPILITPNSALNRVFIRLTAFVFPFLLIKSGNVGKKYRWVTGFLMAPHLKCILKYVNQ